MNLSKTKINLFFLTVVLLGWFLYPKSLFLGYLYEAEEDLRQSETFYLDYIKSRPHSKKAILRLAKLYERKGEPEKGAALLANLVDYRHKDWALAEEYLNYLENMYAPNELYLTRQKIAHRMLQDSNGPRDKAESLLSDAFEYAVWMQKHEEAYSIMLKLLQYGANKSDYENNLETLDWGQKNSESLLKRYLIKNAAEPKNMAIVAELVSLYRALNKIDEAYALLDKSIQLQPKNVELYLIKSYLDEDDGKIDPAIDAIQTAMRLMDKTDPLFVESLRRLAGLFSDQKNYAKALDVTYELLKLNPESYESYQALTLLLAESKNWDELLSFIDKYSDKFPNQREMTDLKLNVLLYEKKDITALDFYTSYLATFGSMAMARDVATLFKEAHRDSELLTWLNSAVQRYPQDASLVLLASDYFATKKRWQESLDWLQKISSPSVEILINKVYILTNLGRKNEARSVLDLLANRVSEKQGLASIVGREFLFLGYSKEAIIYLKRALQVNHLDPWANFWLGEAYYSTLKKKDSVPHYEAVIAYYKGKTKLSDDENRIFIKSVGRLEGSSQVARGYESKCLKPMASIDYKIDWLDLLLEERRFEESKKWLAIFKKDKKIDPKTWKPYEVRLAFGRADYQAASILLESILKEEPGSVAYRRDLVDVYLKRGLWQKATKHLKLIPEELSRELNLGPIKRLIHEDFDNRFSSTFDFVDSGGEELMKEAISLRQTLAAGLYSMAGIEFAQFDSAFTSTKSKITTAFAGFGFFVGNGWNIESLFKSTISSVNDTYAPYFLMHSPRDSVWQAGLELYLKQTDLSVASLVTKGDEVSGGILNGRYDFTERLGVSAMFGLEKHKIYTNETSAVLQLQAGIGYRLLIDPDLRINYDYRYQRAFDSAWTALTGYIPEQNVHYLTLNMAHEFSDTFLGEGAFFIGEDFARDLHLYEADIWGGSAQLQWSPLKWLSLQARYEYGRESQLTNTGSTHRTLLGVSGHWW